MPKIPMLDEKELGKGPHRDLVIALQELHASAGWPSTRSVSEFRGDFPGTLSHERVRAILSGKAIPQWATLETLVRVLVSMRSPSPRDIEWELGRFISLWKAAKAGQYGAVEQLVHSEPAEGVHGDGGSWVPSDVVRMMVNPFYAIEIEPGLALPHEPLISEEEWIGVNLRMISDIGPEGYLRTLIHVLKGGYVTSADPYPAEDEDVAGHAVIDADLADEYVISQILHRLGTEANILSRSISKVRAEVAKGRVELASEIEQLESDINVLRDAMIASPETWGSLSFEAQRLVLIYLIERVVIGPPGPEKVEEQVTIEWRIPLKDNSG